MRRNYLNIFILLLFSVIALNGQDKNQVLQKDRPVVVQPDTIPPGRDSLDFSTDTIPLQTPALPANIKYSPDAPDDEIVYGAVERKWFDLDSNQVHLYGDAFVDYGALKLKAGYIIFNFNTNIAIAEGILDSIGNEVQKPSFTEGDKTFNYKKLRYNFKTKKGFIFNTYTQEGDLFVQGTATKFVSKDADTTYRYDQLFNQDAIITSCDLDHPHFGIRTSKLKVVPEQLAVIGPARLEIADIPTPLIIPFGFFPLVQGKSSGLIFPDNYEYSQQWGFGLQNIGYYFGINDYIDMTVTGDIYLRGSWGLQTQMNYTKRYKYRGGVTLAYASRLTEVPEQIEYAKNRSFALRITHNQDPKAHPYIKIGGSVNFEVGGYTNLNNPSFEARSNSTRRSNMNISHSLPGTPFSLSASLNHSQNINTGIVNMTLPNLQVRMNQIYPLKRKNIVGRPKWYENIALTYSSEAKNFVQANDSTFFSAKTLQDMEYGVKHNASSNVSLKVLKYFNFNPSVNYNETWYFRKEERRLLDTFIINQVVIDTALNGQLITRADTTSYGVRQSDIVNAFVPYRDFNAGASLTTTIFGTKLWSKGKLRGVRHVIKPSVSMNYQPVNRDRYVEFVDTDLRDLYNIPEEYEILPSGVFGAPNLNNLGAFNVSYGIKNDVEAKYFSKQDSTVKNIRVFNNWTFNGNYNLYADSLKFSQVRFNTGNTSFLKGVLNIGFNLNLDPYAINENGRRINEFHYNKTKIPLRFDQMNLTVNTNFTVKRIRELISAAQGKPEKDADRDDSPQLKNQETLLDLFNEFSISHTFRYTGMDEGVRDTFFISTNTISLRGRIKLTDNWNIRVGNFGYDFRNKGFTYPDFGFERNLHCWNMSFSWQPRYGTYSFFIGVSNSTLNFIKANYNQNTGDARSRR